LLNYGLKRVISAQMAYNKIMHIEGQMWSTCDWCSGSKTGIGLKESDPLSFYENVSCVLYSFAMTIIRSANNLFIHTGKRDFPILLWSWGYIFGMCGNQTGCNNGWDLQREWWWHWFQCR
jgi:hypothetical protein